MTSHSPYTVFHLNHDALISLERKNIINKNLDEEAVQHYVNLMSNLPRHDKTINEAFGSGLDDFTEFPVNDPNSNTTDTDKTVRKARSAKALLATDYYVKVAEVNVPKGIDAIKLTQSVNKPWMQSKSKKINIYAMAWRSTAAYDVLKRFDDYFLKMPLGFIDLQNESYAAELV